MIKNKLIKVDNGCIRGNGGGKDGKIREKFEKGDKSTNIIGEKGVYSVYCIMYIVF